MIDYELKSKVLQLDSENSILTINRQYNQLQFIFNDNLPDVRHGKLNSTVPEWVTERLANVVPIATMLMCKFPIEWKEADKINRAFYQRRIRLRKRLQKYFSNGLGATFITFNFTDKFLKNTPLYRRRYISRLLNSLNCSYVANIDFGSENEYIDRHGNTRLGTNREHYHAVINGAFVYSDIAPLHTNGFTYVETCSTNIDDQERLATYVAKLTNHAIKETTKRSTLIYSKD